jgi:murein DD-endopeptidase MepM/ murein hydrolase activator NlpD
MANLTYAKQLKQYLRKRGSPLAPYAQLIAAVEHRYNLPQGLLAGIAAAETTFGTNPAAGRDITDRHNAWGWGPHIAFPSWEHAIRTIGRGLGKNYIAKGLTTPLAIGQKYAPSSDGNNPSHWADTVSSIMSEVGGGSYSPGAPMTGSPSVPLKLPRPAPIKINKQTRIPYATAYSIAAQIASARATGDSSKIVSAMKELYDFAAPQGPPSKHDAELLYGQQTAGSSVGNEVVISPLKTKMPGGSEFMSVDAEGAPGPNGQHYHAAKDWFAPAGTAVAAPVNGKIVEVRASRGRSGQIFGGVVKVQAADGRVYVFRHIDPKKVRPGMRVKAGQLIGTVTAWTDGSPHTHIEIWKTLAGGYNVSNMIDPATVFG